MNETISPPSGEMQPLTVRVAPWLPRDTRDSHTTSGMVRRETTQGLEFSVVPACVGPWAVEALKGLLARALDEVGEGAGIHLLYSGIELDRDKLSAALASWTATEIPIHSIVGFDFAAPGRVPGTRSIGLAALVGQEVEAWPADEAQRVSCARMVVRLAHDLLVNGPVTAETEMPAPDAPRELVTLVPRDGTPPIVEIVF